MIDPQMFQLVCFYAFAAVTVAAALGVIALRNTAPHHSVDQHLIPALAHRTSRTRYDLLQDRVPGDVLDVLRRI